MLLQDEAGIYAIYAAMWVVIIIIWLIWILIAYWAYKDAKKRGMDNPIVWFFVVWCIGCIGLIIYLLVRKKK